MLKYWNLIKHTNRLFASIVILPTALSIVYFAILASDIYVSESRFIVRNQEKPQISGVGLLLKGAGFSNSGEETFAAQSLVNSRDALKVLNQKGAFQKAYSARSISVIDRFDPVGLSGSFEELYSYYQGVVRTEHDTASSIVTLSVKAYSASDAQKFNEQLLQVAESTVNQLNDRARADLIKSSNSEVLAAKERAARAALALSSFRNREGVVDPDRQATVQLQMISKLQDSLIATRAQLAQLRSIGPRSPQIAILQAQARSLSGDIDLELGKIAGNNKSLSTSAAQYQRLQLESQFADRQLASAMASLQEAENEAQRKRAYVERIVQPNKPDHATQPRRIRGIASTLLFSLITWGVLSMMLAGVREHGQ